MTTHCQQCGKQFGGKDPNPHGKRRKCEKCRIEAKTKNNRNASAKYYSENKAMILRRRKRTSQENVALLPDHARTLKRRSYYHRSNIMDAPPEKAAEIIDRILRGKAVLS